MNDNRRDHYQPAGFLGGFSTSAVIPRRERPIWSYNRRTQRLTERKADSVGWIRGLYGGDIDAIWTRYEAALPGALSGLQKGPPDASTWARTLVPFIASMFVRSPTFTRMFEARLGPLQAIAPPGNANRMRSMELQRLLAPVLAARWVFMHTQGDTSVITSDIGWCGYYDHQYQQPGFAIPLNSSLVVGLVPRRGRLLLDWRDGGWHPVVEHRVLNSENQVELNRTIASMAQSDLFGGTRDAIEACLEVEPTTDLRLIDALGLFGLPADDEIANELTWHRLASSLNYAPDNPALSGFEMDADELARGWHPTAAHVGMNVPSFPPSLYRVNDGSQGEGIFIYLHHVVRAEPREWEIEVLNYPAGGIRRLTVPTEPDVATGHATP